MPAAFTCQHCGECCLGRGGVRLNEAEAASAAEFLNMELDDFRRDFLDFPGREGAPPWDIAIGGSGKCLFSQADGRCRIHPVKPQVCRAWPYLPGPLKVESAFLEAKAACPGLRRDLTWTEFKAGHSQAPTDASHPSRLA